jgi:hypothetical protein
MAILAFYDHLDGFFVEDGANLALLLLLVKTLSFLAA